MLLLPYTSPLPAFQLLPSAPAPANDNDPASGKKTPPPATSGYQYGAPIGYAAPPRRPGFGPAGAGMLGAGAGLLGGVLLADAMTPDVVQQTTVVEDGGAGGDYGRGDFGGGFDGGGFGEF